jgi:hypothetical protein
MVENTGYNLDGLRSSFDTPNSFRTTGGYIFEIILYSSLPHTVALLFFLGSGQQLRSSLPEPLLENDDASFDEQRFVVECGALKTIANSMQMFFMSSRCSPALSQRNFVSMPSALNWTMSFE